MAIEFGPWLKLNVPTIDSLPDAPGVFEIANLVRTVIFTGRAEGSLQRRLATLGGVPANLPASTGGYYVRLALTSDEEAALAECQASYRAVHGGRLPVGNETPVRPAIRLVTRDAA
jgi:hypothetical protein